METAESELHYDSPFHLLIAVILSAQCTDKRVNMHTPVIFKRFPQPQDLASATFEEVYELIKSISFPNKIFYTFKLAISFLFHNPNRSHPK